MGSIDADEKEAIFKRLETMPLSSEEKAFVFDELASPLDIDAVVARADTPEHASEIYAASLVAMTPDSAAERAYLEALAFKLKLPAGLVAEIHRRRTRGTRPRSLARRVLRANQQRLSYKAVRSCAARSARPCRAQSGTGPVPAWARAQARPLRIAPWKSVSTRSPKTPLIP
jgi:hypothetical protein